ncbi:hypothetical protein LTR53_008999 [Teratosphaeriaceae sp. CCFEE 6253]|nr:hypothetical protein LTR53_008999 [Teratosphaeriaceae sp. CCFEE 6253]
MVSEDLMISVGRSAPPMIIMPPRKTRVRNRKKIVKADSITPAATVGPIPQVTPRKPLSASPRTKERADALATADQGPPRSLLLRETGPRVLPQHTSASAIPESTPDGESTQSLVSRVTPSLTAAESDAVDPTELASSPASAARGENEEGTTVLDPDNSMREYRKDPLPPNTEREVWRPGDGDGLENTDYHARPGVRPMHERWRLYQLDTSFGLVSADNLPPKFVFLDDKAAYEVECSNISRTKLLKWWPHDFAATGTIRNRRPHRGRPAILDASQTGDARYQFALQGDRKQRYYFTGAKDYKPVIYAQIPTTVAHDPTSAPNGKRQASALETEADTLKRKRGHNQHTPKEELVKNGAPSAAAKPRKPKPLISYCLTESTIKGRGRRRPYGTTGNLAGPSPLEEPGHDLASATLFAGGPITTSGDDDGDSFWVNQADVSSVSSEGMEEAQRADPDEEYGFGDTLGMQETGIGFTRTPFGAMPESDAYDGGGEATSQTQANAARSRLLEQEMNDYPAGDRELHGLLSQTEKKMVGAPPTGPHVP